jgi:uncharacterized protein YaiL (DUF2058 family)
VEKLKNFDIDLSDIRAEEVRAEELAAAQALEDQTASDMREREEAAESRELISQTVNMLTDMDPSF